MTARQLLSTLRDALAASAADAPGAGQLAAVSSIDVDMAVVTPTSPLSWNGRGYELLYPADGNPPGHRLRVDFRGGGNLAVMAPGSRIRVPFDGFDLYRGAGGVGAGVARLYVVRRPDCELALGMDGGGLGADVTVVGPNGAATQAVALAEGGANAPVAATDGVSLSGVESIVALLSAGAARTLNAGGYLRAWLYFRTTARWHWNELQVAPSVATGLVRDWSSDDLARLTRSGAGRLYLEAVGQDTSDNSAFTVYLARYGRLT